MEVACPARPSRRRTHAFTRVELLVVIVIIATLVSLLLLPAQAGARAAARLLACGNNLKQQGVVFLVYHDDTGGWLPLGNAGHGGSPAYPRQCSHLFLDGHMEKTRRFGPDMPWNHQTFTQSSHRVPRPRFSVVF
jgi:hypothetical protein